MDHLRRWLALGAILLVLSCTGERWVPRDDRVWEPHSITTPWAERDGRTVIIHGLRDTSYLSSSEFTPRYSDTTVQLDDLITADYALIPIAAGGRIAHTIITFGFRDGTHIAFSVEARKEADEHYSPWWGMARQYELLYVVAAERDVLRTRIVDRDNEVYLYPLNLTREQRERAFLALAEDATRTHGQPRWYHSIWRSCTTTVTQAVNEVSPGRIPWSWKLILTGYADGLAYDLGLIDTTLPKEELRAAYRIDLLACEDQEEDAAFAACIRSGRPEE